MYSFRGTLLDCHYDSFEIYIFKYFSGDQKVNILSKTLKNDLIGSCLCRNNTRDRISRLIISVTQYPWVIKLIVTSKQVTTR